jgi:hypothetical protein
MSQSTARTFERPFADEDAASDHRIKLYKYLTRLSSAEDTAGESEFERRAALQRELAAQRHPRWRGTENR